MTVDSIDLPHDVKLCAREDTGPLQQRLWPTVAFLVDGGLISDGSCTSDHGSESGLDHGTESDSDFSDFLERDDTVPNLESGTSDCSPTPIRSDPASISHLTRGENPEKGLTSDIFMKNPSLKPFWTPLSVRMWRMLSRFRHPQQEGVVPSLFKSIKQDLLPAGSRDLAIICPKVVAVEQVKVHFAMSEGKRFSPSERTPASLLSLSRAPLCLACTERHSSS